MNMKKKLYTEAINFVNMSAKWSHLLFNVYKRFYFRWQKIRKTCFQSFFKIHF